MKIIYIAAILPFVAGCQLLGPDYKRPEINLPAEYADTLEGAVNNEEIEELSNEDPLQVSNTWWTLYEDETLNELVDKALKNNTDIKLAVSAIEQADAYAKEIGAFGLPSVDFNTDTKRSRVTNAGAFPVFADNPNNNYSFKLSSSFEIDFWGKLARSKESARAAALASLFAKDTTALTLSGLVATYYIQLRSLDTQLILSKDSLHNREVSLDLTKQRLKGGVASALDVRQAEVAYSNLLAQIYEIKRLRSVAEHQLAVLTGDLNLKLSGTGLDTLSVAPLPPVGLPSRLLENRPDIKQAEQNLIAANAQIGVAKAALFPTISMTAGFGGESLELSDLLKSAARTWNSGIGLYLPVFNAGKLNAKLDQVTAQQKQALINYEAVIQNAFREVSDALSNMRFYLQREAALEASQKSASEAVKIAQNRYEAGYSAYIDVLDAQRTYNEAALAYAETRQARLSTTVDLFRVLGGGWSVKADTTALK